MVRLASSNMVLLNSSKSRELEETLASVAQSQSLAAVFLRIWSLAQSKPSGRSSPKKANPLVMSREPEKEEEPRPEMVNSLETVRSPVKEWEAREEKERVPEMVEAVKEPETEREEKEEEERRDSPETVKSPV